MKTGTPAVWTPEHSERLKTYLFRQDYIVNKSIGDRENACSMGAIQTCLG